MFIRAYLRASTEEQDATRAQAELLNFTQSKDVKIASQYIESKSGAKMDRPELARLIADSHPGDILLIEKVDRLSRLPYEQWKKLKTQLIDAKIHIVVVDQLMTHGIINGSEENSMIAKVLTEFMIDLAAAMARDDYETRRKRQAQGILKAQELGKYQGRQPDLELRENIKLLINEDKSWSQVQNLWKCSRSTIAKAVKG
ncbi:resolvase [Pseudoalteromonas sp. NBT06-2]|uniref:recombinase family protein n=1 Tax=Pseudoalteromonas sp. NBT06-2 TaxID=2025950 RepID=UPI000BA7D68B|nr:recombinase family protein [Pseudoalteromonas sp. NBT06-2]PAJ71816.1 resolvase [Pseudoalteromonas sp. NBT06-2]